MSYDIPDQIKYKEKIIFKLNFKQLCYMAAFVLLAFLSLNLPIQGEGKLVLPAIFIITGLAFTYLNLEEKVLDVIDYHTNVKNSGGAQNLMGIIAIKENTVFLQGNKLRAVLKIEPVNFRLLEQDQKKALILSYREFLNHLTDSIQILVKTNEPDLENYFIQTQNKLKQKSKGMREVFNGFMQFEKQFMKENHVRERSFYLIIPQDPTSPIIGKILIDKDFSLEQLEQKTRIIQEKLGACGLKSKRLENKELARLYEFSFSEEQQNENGKEGTKTS